MGGGRSFEAGRLLNFSNLRVGAYSRWALIRGWVINRINKVYKFSESPPLIFSEPPFRVSKNF